MFAFFATLHLLATIVWVGGMFFAHFVLRPTATQLLEPPQRLPFLSQIFVRFFKWVWLAILLLWVTGLWIIFYYYGGFSKLAIYIHIMLTLAIVMTILFTYLFFVPHRNMQMAISQKDFAAAAQHLGVIRRIVFTNLILGLTIAIIVVIGKYWV
jgi:uncharacterized membrane protein